MNRYRWFVAIVIVAVLLITDYLHEILAHFIWYQTLYRKYPFYVPEGIDKVAGTLLCVAAVWLLQGGNLRAIGRQLAISAPVFPAAMFALVVSSPMWIGFAITRQFSPSLPLIPVLFLSVLSPIVEEIEFRGFGVRQLQLAVGLPFWIAVWPSALLTGLGHIEQGQTVQEMIGLFLLTGAGGVEFAWLMHKWDNLWVPIALHVCMNLWWEMFSVSKTALGAWFPFLLQSSTMLLAILLLSFGQEIGQRAGSTLVSA